MKTLCLTLVCCLGCLQMSIAQVAAPATEQTPQELYDFHMEKKKSNNLAGWLTLGGGLGMVAGGVATRINNCLFSCEGNNGNGLIYTGIGVTVSSVYFFIKAADHRKLAQIQLKNGAVGINRDITYSGLSVTFNF